MTWRWDDEGTTMSGMVVTLSGAYADILIEAIEAWLKGIENV